MTKLFRVRSKINHFPHKERIYDSVELCWFVVYREAPAFSYEQLIEEYGNQLDSSSYISENNLNELFTEREAGILKEYILRVHKQGCVVKEANLLLEYYSFGYEDIVLGYEEGLYKLDEEEYYNLPFVVLGYYDAGCAQDVSWLRHGMEFIEKATDKLGAATIDKDKSKSVVKDLKDESLLVDRDVKEQEKTKINPTDENETAPPKTQVKKAFYK